MQPVLRHAQLARSALSLVPRRTLAIAATVRTARDTSAQTFPAPSHVSVAAEAHDIARQIREFYSNPKSTLEFSEEARAQILDELCKRAATIPEGALSPEWVVQNMKDKIPSKVVIGDNPYFKDKSKPME